MLSIETARKLKDAGLKWEPQIGDYCYSNASGILLSMCELDLSMMPTVYNTFAPRLDQLLAEGDKRGYLIEVLSYYLIPEQKIVHKGLVSQIYDTGKITQVHCTHLFKERAEAAAQALLWILQEGKA